MEPWSRLLAPRLLLDLVPLYATFHALGLIWPGTSRGARLGALAGIISLDLALYLPLLLSSPDLLLVLNPYLLGFLPAAAGAHVVLARRPISVPRTAPYILAIALDVAVPFVHSPATGEFVTRRTVMIYVVALAGSAVSVLARVVLDYGNHRAPDQRRSGHAMIVTAVIGAFVPIVNLGWILLGADPTTVGLTTGNVLFLIMLAIVVIRGALVFPESYGRIAVGLLLTVSGLVLRLAMQVLLMIAVDQPVTGLLPLAVLLFALALLKRPRFRWQRLPFYLLQGARRPGGHALNLVGARLLSCQRRDQITRVLCEEVGTSIPNSDVRVYLGPHDDGTLHEIAGTRRVDAELSTRISSGRTVTSSDARAVYDDTDDFVATREALRTLDASILMPIGSGEAFVGALALGRRAEDSAFLPSDVSFLRGLCTEAALALRNAEAFEQLEQLNATLEARVVERTAQLDAQSREISLYAKAVSHDLRRPIVAALEALRLVTESDSSAASRWHERAVDNLRRADRMLGGLRDLMLQGALAHEQAMPFSSAALVHEAVAAIRERPGTESIDFVIAPEMPEVLAQRRKIAIVFENLIGNAVRATAAVTHPRIEIGAEEQADEATFWVVDNGTGVAPGLQARIFEPLAQGPGSDGMGLGLALVRQIVEQHDGEVWVESQEGAGARFFLTLPLAKTS